MALKKGIFGAVKKSVKGKSEKFVSEQKKIIEQRKQQQKYENTIEYFRQKKPNLMPEEEKIKAIHWLIGNGIDPKTGQLKNLHKQLLREHFQSLGESKTKRVLQNLLSSLEQVNPDLVRVLKAQTDRLYEFAFKVK